MIDALKVGISDMKVAKCPQPLVTFALGSCVGICLYDPVVKIGALGHIMLPNHTGGADNNAMKFADTCIPLMLNKLKVLGCSGSRMVAKIAGGAKMFEVAGDNSFGNIGQRNVVAVKETLRAAGIRIFAEDTGENYGRTVYFYTDTGRMEVRSFSRETKVY